MPETPPRMVVLTESDLDFVVSEAAQVSTDTDHLKLLIEEDEQFRAAILGDENVFQRLMADEETFLRVSPALYFEVLLRQALRDLETAGYTVERDGRADLPVFDTPEVVRFLSIQGVLDYLAHMLASFTRVNSYAVPVRIRRGIRRRVVYNDMDIDSLVRLCATADWEQRFGYYKRIADVCLFISGVFPDYASPAMRYSVPNRMRTAVSDRTRRSLSDYEVQGSQFYGLAEEHDSAQHLGLSGVFRLLRDHFATARKPLSFIASHYLHGSRGLLFGAPYS